jgi:hypothetical protein
VVALPTLPEGLYRADMSQIYPDHRSLVTAIAKAYEVAEMVQAAG